MVGSEVYSAEVKKTEVLMENFRRAIGKIHYFVLSKALVIFKYKVVHKFSIRKLFLIHIYIYI